MKKMGIVFMTGLCLVSSDISASVFTIVDVYAETPEQRIEPMREEMRDEKKLREHMEKLLGGRTTPERSETIMRKFDVSKDAMRSILLDVIRESSVKTKWEMPQQRKPEDIFIASHYLCEAITWLGVCADAEGKRLLMGIAEDSAKDKEFRFRALDSYVRCADVQETRDTITRFLADDMRATFHPPDLHYIVMWAYDKAKDDAQTREVIVTAMSTALLKEANSIYFADADKLLAERSTEYAESPQRKATLDRMNKPPE